MNISQLQYFLAVFDCGSYTSAAEVMYTSRQTLGRAVTELEKEIGHELFSRKGRGIEPTPVGVEAAEIARTIVSNAHRLTSFTDALNVEQPLEAFSIAIAYDKDRGAVIDPVSLLALTSSVKRAKINVAFLPSEACLVAVIRGAADAAIVMGRADYPEYENEFVGRKPALVAMGKNNPLAHKKALVINDLEHATIAYPDNFSFFYPRVNAVCESCGFNPEWQPVNINEDLNGFLERGGLAFVYENSPIVQSNANLRVIPVDEATKLNYPIFFVDGKNKRDANGRAVMHAIMDSLA